jgi:hypothetical protein
VLISLQKKKKPHPVNLWVSHSGSGRLPRL